jgi:saccharopine dehydrogenase-like NADP-dependent oxidoreductase
LQNLTLHHPGHLAQLRAFFDLRLWNLTLIRIAEVEVVGRDVFHVLFAPRVTFPEDTDVVSVRVKALGKKGGWHVEAVVQVIDYFDHATDFTAMERATKQSGAGMSISSVDAVSP